MTGYDDLMTMIRGGTREFTNWSGSLRFTPGERVVPDNEDEVVDLVRGAAERGATIRPVGAGHSSSPLARTDDILMSSDGLSGLVRHTDDTATIRPGTYLGDVGPALHEVGLALENYGDVDLQSIGGAVGTGTHGTGRDLTAFSGMLVGARLVTGKGEVLDVDTDDMDLLRAMRVSLGVLGVVTELTLRVRTPFELHRREWCVPVQDCLANLDALIGRNRNVDFYWHPRRDEAQLRTHNHLGEDPDDLFASMPCPEGLHREKQGWSHEVIPQGRGLEFEEMEYMLPAEAFVDCFREIRARVIEKHRQYVAWRVLCRVIAPEDGYLSPYNGGETMTIALLQNNTLPYRGYHEDLEPVLRAHGGRPHWGKHHSLDAGELRPLYPDWDRFAAVRERLDPNGVFLSEDMRALLVGPS